MITKWLNNVHSWHFPPSAKLFSHCQHNKSFRSERPSWNKFGILHYAKKWKVGRCSWLTGSRRARLKWLRSAIRFVCSWTVFTNPSTAPSSLLRALRTEKFLSNQNFFITWFKQYLHCTRQLFDTGFLRLFGRRRAKECRTNYTCYSLIKHLCIYILYVIDCCSLGCFMLLWHLMVSHSKQKKKPNYKVKCHDHTKSKRNLLMDVWIW